MNKISLIGVGRVGSTLAYLLVSNPKVDEIILLDVVKSKVDGTIFDISHAYPEFSYKLKVGSYQDIKESDMVIISAGLPRTPETKTRMDLLNVNKKIIQDIIKSINFSNNPILIILTNPVEPLTYLAYKLSDLPSKKVIGFGNILDSERLRFILSKKTYTNASKINSFVIGEHGENMIPIFSQCTINEKNITSFDLNFLEIRHELLSTSKEIIKLIGGTQFGPAKCVEKLINAILYDKNEILSVSSFIQDNDFYEINNVCISLPARIGKNGIHEIVKFNLNDEEKTQLKELTLKLKRIQKSIGV